MREDVRRGPHTEHSRVTVVPFSANAIDGSEHARDYGYNTKHHYQLLMDRAREDGVQELQLNVAAVLRHIPAAESAVRGDLARLPRPRLQCGRREGANKKTGNIHIHLLSLVPCLPGTWHGNNIPGNSCEGHAHQNRYTFRLYRFIQRVYPIAYTNSRKTIFV